MILPLRDICSERLNSPVQHCPTCNRILEREVIKWKLLAPFPRRWCDGCHRDVAYEAAK